MKERKSTLANGWKKQKTLVISSNEAICLLKTSACIVLTYFPT